MDADTNDPDLVAAALGGDRSALGDIYDRYADRVHDMCLHMLRDRDEAADVCAEVFLVAFARLGQLRDPERLRSWLFAIARHEVYRRSRQRSRTQLVEEVGQMDRLMAERAAAVDELDAGVADTATMVTVLRDAAAGLDDRDRMVMELQLQGLDGEELAAALGTSVSTGYQQVHRMRERLERSVGAVLVARQGRADCDSLDRVLAGWDGTFSVLWRKRVARHVDGCEVCERRRKAIPATLLGGAAAALPMVPVSAVSAVPASVRERVLAPAEVATVDGGRGWRSDGFPGPDRSWRAGAFLVAAVAILVLVVGGAWFAVVGDEPERLAATGASPTTTSIAEELPEVTTTSVVPAPAPTAAPTTVPVAPPSTTSPPAVTTTTVQPEPAPPAQSDTTTVDAAPQVELVLVPAVLYRPISGFSTCSVSTDVVAAAGATATRVELWWRSTAGADDRVDTVAAAGDWRAVVELPKEVVGPVTLLAVAYDDAGRTGVSATTQVPVRDCPTAG